MPRKYQRKEGARRYKDYSDKTIQEALRCIRTKVMTVNQAGKRFKIPVPTLTYKMRTEMSRTSYKTSICFVRTFAIADL